MNEKREDNSNKPLVINREQVLSSNRTYWFFKRVFDIVLCAAALAVLLVPGLILCALICIDSPGASPIFVQKRCGRDGKIFKFYKFRSMVPDAEALLPELLDKNEMEGPAFKMKEDPRITKVGRFIRRYSIDELPQVLCVLKGDMCIVGPRPALPREVAEYTPYDMQRLYITPGLTCYWQVTPHRNDLSFDEWLELDLKYIRHRSIFIDIKLILETLLVMLRGEGI